MSDAARKAQEVRSILERVSTMGLSSPLHGSGPSLSEVKKLEDEARIALRHLSEESDDAGTFPLQPSDD